jgi:signal transduction histidine kinase/CheY-like chemotaxis protein
VRAASRSSVTSLVVSIAAGSIVMMTAPRKEDDAACKSWWMCGLRPLSRAAIAAGSVALPAWLYLALLLFLPIDTATSRTIATFIAVGVLYVLGVQAALELHARETAQALRVHRRSPSLPHCFGAAHPLSILLTGTAHLVLYLLQEQLSRGSVMGQRLMMNCLILILLILPIIALLFVEGGRNDVRHTEQERLEATSNYLYAFVGHVSHETRVPLQNAVLGVEELMLDVRKLSACASDHAVASLDSKSNVAPSSGEVAEAPKPSIVLPSPFGEGFLRSATEGIHSPSSKRRIALAVPASPTSQSSACRSVADGSLFALMQESLSILNISLHTAEEVLGQALQLQNSEARDRGTLAGKWTALEDLVPMIKSLFLRHAHGHVAMEIRMGPGTIGSKGYLDPFVLASVTSVFLSNAIKFHPRGSEAGPIVTRVSLSGFARTRRSPLTLRDMLWPGADDAPAGTAVERALVIEVEDRGPGVTGSNRKELFQPFQHIASGEVVKGVGTGVRLAMCRALARAMGGFVGYQDPTDGSRGAVLLVVIPILHMQASSGNNDWTVEIICHEPSTRRSHQEADFSGQHSSETHSSTPTAGPVMHEDHGWRDQFMGERAVSFVRDDEPGVSAQQVEVTQSDEDQSHPSRAGPGSPTEPSRGEELGIEAVTPPVAAASASVDTSALLSQAPEMLPSITTAGILTETQHGGVTVSTGARSSRAEREMRRMRRASARGVKATAEERPRTVMLVEDVESTRRMMARSLGRLGVTVITAEDGADALRVLRGHVQEHLKGEVDPRCPSGVLVVLLDKDMPVSGFEFMDNLHRMRGSSDPVETAMSSVRIVGCTAHGVPATVRGFLDRGAVDVLIKPAGSEDFHRVLRDALASLKRLAE